MSRVRGAGRNRFFRQGRRGGSNGDLSETVRSYAGRRVPKRADLHALSRRRRSLSIATAQAARLISDSLGLTRRNRDAAKSRVRIRSTGMPSVNANCSAVSPAMHRSNRYTAYGFMSFAPNSNSCTCRPKRPEMRMAQTFPISTRHLPIRCRRFRHKRRRSRLCRKAGTRSARTLTSTGCSSVLYQCQRRSKNGSSALLVDRYSGRPLRGCRSQPQHS